MPPFVRDLHLYADGREIAWGCPMTLEARESLTLRPALHHLEIRDLSESSEAWLSCAQAIELRSGNSILAFGERMECLTRTASGKRVTSVVFSRGLSLWNASVALSVPAGMKVRDTMQAVLAASEMEVPLAAFAAEDRSLVRPQAFFGRACDALSLLAETVEADAFLSAAGLCISGRAAREPGGMIPENSLLSKPIRTGSRLLITTSMLGWPIGAFVRVSWQGSTWTGRLVSRMIQADNREGPWKSELEVEL